MTYKRPPGKAREHDHNYRFGGNREKAIQRDGEKCVERDEDEVELDPIHERVREEARKKIKAIYARIACAEVKPEGDES